MSLELSQTGNVEREREREREREKVSVGTMDAR
jgi:hypothetical protein